MKLTKLILLLSNILILVTLIFAENTGKSGKKKFLNINPNITNQNLRMELENLSDDFKNKRQRIYDKYQIEIDALKEKRRLQIQSIKSEFGEKRDGLYIKYGEKEKQSKSAKKPNKLKREKGKKIKK
tara:strand:- start:100 stop:480 length:381 start_codon:yes stop_codon:yes gene_type:complete